MLFFVMRPAQDFHSPLSFRSLYCSFGCSHWEYASSFLNPLYTEHIRNLKRVQLRFLRQVSFRMFHEYRTYEELQSFLGIPNPVTNIVNKISHCPHTFWPENTFICSYQRHAFLQNLLAFSKGRILCKKMESGWSKSKKRTENCEFACVPRQPQN